MIFEFIFSIKLQNRPWHQQIVITWAIEGWKMHKPVNHVQLYPNTTTVSKKKGMRIRVPVELVLGGKGGQNNSQNAN